MKGHRRSAAHALMRWPVPPAPPLVGAGRILAPADCGRRRGGGGDNSARGHPADERALAFREIRFQRGCEGRDGPGHDDQDRDEDERGQYQVPGCTAG